MSLGDEGTGDVVGVIDTATGEETAQFGEGRPYRADFASEEHVATHDYDRILILDTTTGEEAHTVHGVTQPAFEVVPKEQALIYVDDGHLVWWDYTENTEVRDFELPGFEENDDPRLLDVTAAPDANRVYATWLDLAKGDLLKDFTEYTNHVWDLETGDDLLANNDTANFNRVAVHPDDEVLAVTTADDRLELVDPETMESLGPLF